MEGKRGSECLLKSVSNIDFNPMCMGYSTQNIYAEFMSDFIPLIILLKLNDVTFKARMGENKGKFLIGMNNTKNN